MRLAGANAMTINPASEPSPPNPDGTGELESVVAAYQAPLLRYAQRFLRDCDAAQDAVQEVFLRYLKAPPRERDPRSLSSWLYRATHNLCVDQIRKEVHMRAQMEQMDPPEPAPSPARVLQIEESRERTERLLRRLTENQRTLLVLRVYEGKTYREISEITGLSVSNVGVQIYQGLKKLAGLIRSTEVVES